LPFHTVTILKKAGIQSSVYRGKTLLSEIHFNQGFYHKALETALLAESSSEKLKDFQNIARTKNLIAKIYVKQNKVKKASQYFLEAISYGKKYHMSQNLIRSQRSYAEFLLTQEKLDLAEKILLEALIVSKSAKTPENEVAIYKLLEIKHEHNNDLEQAYKLSKKRQNLMDSLSQREKYELIERLEKEYDNQKTETALAQSRVKNLQNEQTIIWLAIGTIIVLVIAFFIYLTNKIKQRNIKLKYEKNEEILKRKNLEIQKNKEIESAKAEIKGQEAERKRLAKELHDGLGGTLATIKLNLSLADSESTYKKVTLKPIINSLDNACQEVRIISHHLLPKVFENKSLTEAIQKYFSDVSKASNLEVNLEIFPKREIENIQPAKKNDIYRILQELTTNTLKHGQASNLDVQLIQHDDYLSLIVEDDGIGFSQDQKPTGIGLQNIQSRILLLNGVLHIDSKPDRGTLIDIQIPSN